MPLIVFISLLTCACTEAPSDNAPKPDGQAPRIDAATPQADAATQPADAGPLPFDMAPPQPDTATPEDSVPPASDAGGPTFVDFIDFDHWSEGTAYGVSEVNTDFLPLAGVSKFTPRADDPGGLRECTVVADPSGDPARGNVLRIKWSGSQRHVENHFSLFHHFSDKHENLFPQTTNLGGLDPTDYPLSNEANGTTANPGVPPLAQAIAREDAHEAHVSTGGRPYRFDELHMAWDIYLPVDWQFINYHKMSGMCTGTALQATHGKYATANREGFYGFTAQIMLAGDEWGPVRKGALEAYLYHTDRTQWVQAVNKVDPKRAPADASEYYIMPRGKWVSIEQRVKLNSADDDFETIDNTPSLSGASAWGPVAETLGLKSQALLRDAPSAGDKVDGVVEIWVQEEEWPKAKMMLTRTLRLRTWRYLKITQAFIRSYNNNNSKTNPTLPNVDQYLYYDNFRWNTGPILPR